MLLFHVPFLDVLGSGADILASLRKRKKEYEIKTLGPISYPFPRPPKNGYLVNAFSPLLVYLHLYCPKIWHGITEPNSII